MGKMQYHSYLLYDPRRIDLQNLAIFEKRSNRDSVLMRHKNAAVINADDARLYILRNEVFERFCVKVLGIDFTALAKFGMNELIALYRTCQITDKEWKKKSKND